MQRTRTLRALALLSGIALVAALCAGGADAAPPYEEGNPSNTSVTLPTASTSPPPPPCTSSGDIWASNPRVIVHTKEYVGSATVDDMVTAVTDIDGQIALTGATTAAVTQTVRSTAAFHFKQAYGDTVSTIHVGFVNFIAPKAGSSGTVLAQTDPSITDGPCETHIAVVESGASWDYGTPSNATPAGQLMYYDAGRSNADGVDYFRAAYLHELLHAFGLDHTATGYGLMNYGERPWARGASNRSMALIADDVEHLRGLYPSSTSHTSVAVLNSWLDDDADTANGAGRQELLCAPSKGASSADAFDDRNGTVGGVTGLLDDGFRTCGKDGSAPGSTDICGGGTIRSRVAFTNHSTEAVDVTVRYWLSTDDVWNATDVLSPTLPPVVHVSHTGSHLLTDTWTLPTLSTASTHLSGGTLSYYVIARVEATTVSGTTVRDWIPLRGQLTVNPMTCATF